MNTQWFSLDRNWRFTRQKLSVLPSTLDHGTVYGFSKGDGAQGPAALNFDDGDWEQVTLPHDWQHTMPFDLNGISSHGYYPSGDCWYRRTFMLEPEDAECEIQLLFDGISGISDVYFNGAKLRHNESCYNGFSLSLSDIANYGITPNVLTVRVDKTVWEGWWYEGCGINRHVWLVKRPRLHIVHDGLAVQPIKGKEDDWQVNCEATIYNASPVRAKGTLRLTAVSPLGEEAASAQRSVSLGAYEKRTLSIPLRVAQPTLWNLENPTLYSLRAELNGAQGKDQSNTRFGFRTIRISAKDGFYLNDQPVKLLGTCNHQDHAGVGAAIPKELWRYRLKQLKAMGSNAYRCSHNPPPPELLDLCDEMGMLVMDENRSFSTSEDALSLLRSMVRRDQNHPCVVMYSLFNEEPMQGTPKGKRLAQHQMAELKKLDATRPVLGAFNGGMFEETGAGQCMDITGINYFIDSFDTFHKRYPRQPIVSSEIASAFATRGEWVSDTKKQVFGNYDEDCAAWGETARAANLAVLKRPFVMGMFVWTGLDYRGEPTPYEWPSVSSHFGIMDTCGFPKDVYYLYQAFWKKEACLHLLPHWNHSPGDKVRVMAYTNCDEVELFVNGRSQGKKENTMEHSAEWQVSFEPGVLEAVGYRNGERCATDKRETVGAPAQLRLESAMAYLYPDTDSVAAVTISMTDEQGRECPLDKTKTKIAVTGGTLLGVGNGDPNGHDPDQGNSCRLFNGRGQLIVSAAPEAKQVVIHASAKGVQDAEITLSVKERAFPPALADTGLRLLDGWRMSHEPLSQRPDPALVLSANDMNTMEPVSFTGEPQRILSGAAGMYCLYQTTAELGASKGKRYLILNRVQGTAEIFVDGKPLFRKECFTAERLEITIPSAIHGRRRISIIIRNESVDKQAGIFDPALFVALS
ncbi:MAG: beta-galactosidase GalA [Eubacteriales bacterium]|nr:beta-galactosidase GalA [Eubacteriales bacterium]